MDCIKKVFVFFILVVASACTTLPAPAPSNFTMFSSPQTVLQPGSTANTTLPVTEGLLTDRCQELTPEDDNFYLCEDRVKDVDGSQRRDKKVILKWKKS